MKMHMMVLSMMLGLGLAGAHEGQKHEAAPQKAEVARSAERGEGGQKITVKGEILDMACYMAHEGKGKKHKKCAQQCVLGGAPVGLLTADGKVYLLVEDHSSVKTKKPYAEAKERVGEIAVIKGDHYERGGVQAIVVVAASKE